MKKIFILFISILLSFSIYAQGNINVTFKYKIINSIKGYTYKTKLVLERNGKKVGESKVKDQEQVNETTFSIPKGTATLKATLYALYEGKWEARTADNDYSFDCIYEKNRNWSENATITLTADITEFTFDAEESFSKKNKKDDFDDLLYNEDEGIDDDYDKAMEKLNKYSSKYEEVSNANYENELATLNRYLKRFKGGYYGYMEINDGYLYDNYLSGKYSKMKISDIDKVIEVETNKEVAITCKNGKECVYSTYTDSYHDEMPFSNNGETFNTKELINMLNNVINAYKNTGSSSSSSNNTTTSSSSVKYKAALDKVNNYLKTFDSGYYGYLEIKDGYLYDRFKSGKYSKVLISDLDKAVEETPNTKVVIKCSGSKECVFSTYTDSYHNQMSFSQDKSFNTKELIDLLNNLIAAYKN